MKLYISSEFPNIWKLKKVICLFNASFLYLHSGEHKNLIHVVFCCRFGHYTEFLFEFSDFLLVFLVILISVDIVNDSLSTVFLSNGDTTYSILYDLALIYGINFEYLMAFPQNAFGLFYVIFEITKTVWLNIWCSKCLSDNLKK